MTIGMRDWAVQQVTAFQSYDALARACRKGYAPTLKASESDSSQDQRAKRWLVNELSRQGLSVYV